MSLRYGIKSLEEKQKALIAVLDGNQGCHGLVPEPEAHHELSSVGLCRVRETSEPYFKQLAYPLEPLLYDRGS